MVQIRQSFVPKRNDSLENSLLKCILVIIQDFFNMPGTFITIRKNNRN